MDTRQWLNCFHMWMLWNAFKKKKNAIDEVLVTEGIYTEELKQKCLETYRCHKPDIHLYDGVEGMLGKLRNMGAENRDYY